ncbi:MAG: NFACT RNA binding domain-containing protein [Bacteroidetes bacterium]|nr:NFACT RNA binding domain-containing protein [Bacteroidota bacterium]
MLTNYFTLLQLSQYFNQNYSGWIVLQIFSQQKNQLCIILKNINLNETTIIISCEPGNNFIFANSQFVRAKKNSVDLFVQLQSKILTSVRMIEFDRIMVFEFENFEIHSQFFGSASNIILIDKKSKTIIDCFKNKKELDKLNLNYSDKLIIKEKKYFFDELFLNNVSASELKIKLRNLFPQLGQDYIEHVLIKVSEYESSQTFKEFLWNEINQLIIKLSNSNQLRSIIYFQDSPLTLSQIPLLQYQNYHFEEWDNINDAIKYFIRESFIKIEFQRQKNLLLNFIISNLSRIKKTITRHIKKEDLENRIKEYEHFGNLLLINLNGISNFRGSAVEVKDVCHNFTPINISLDSKLTILENSQRYFVKAKKLRSSLSIDDERFIKLTNLKKLNDELVLLLEEVHSLSALKKYFVDHQNQLKNVGYMEKSEDLKGKPYRVFKVNGDFEVWVGKSSKDNDELTLRYAKPHDLWFHIRGASGSHVILKIDSAKGEPSKLAIEQAAAIAGYYSKMKSGKNVPVAMTEKKYVRKPKNVPVGTVTIEKEKIIFVNPKLPVIKNIN